MDLSTMGRPSAAPNERRLRHVVATICGVGLCGLTLLACAASGPDASRVATPLAPERHTTLHAERLAAASSGEQVPTFVEVREPLAQRDDDALMLPYEPFATVALLEQPCTGATAAWFSLGSSELDAEDRLRLDDLLSCLEREELDASALHVDGYATPLEQAIFGRELASERARVVARYLDVRAALTRRPDSLRVRGHETTP